MNALRDIAQRAVNTFAQSYLASIGVSSMTGVEGIAWWPVTSIALVATLISVLQNVIKHTGDGIEQQRFTAEEVDAQIVAAVEADRDSR